MSGSDLVAVSLVLAVTVAAPVALAWLLQRSLPVPLSPWQRLAKIAIRMGTLTVAMVPAMGRAAQAAAEFDRQFVRLQKVLDGESRVWFTGGMAANDTKETNVNTVYTTLVYERDNCDGIEGVGISVYASLDAAVEAMVQGILEDNRLDECDDPEGEPVTEAEVRALVKVDEQFGTASAFDPWNEIDWLVQKIEVQA